MHTPDDRQRASYLIVSMGEHAAYRHAFQQWARAARSDAGGARCAFWRRVLGFIGTALQQA